MKEKWNKEMKEKDIFYLYDNCSSHHLSISGWWMRNIDSYTLTNCTYTPEFNPIEYFFNTVKWTSSDGVERDKLLELTEYIAWRIN